MPVPDGPRVVDLAFRAGAPAFAEVLDGLLAELVVEGATAATEVRAANAACAELLDGLSPPSNWSRTSGSRSCRRARG
ncbi:D-ribose pyranase [Streptomyces tendae]